MASRSTRNRIKHQATKAMDNIEMILIHLKNIDDFAADRSAWITKNMPALVSMTLEYQKFIKRFNAGL